MINQQLIAKLVGMDKNLEIMVYDENRLCQLGSVTVEHVEFVPHKDACCGGTWVCREEPNENTVPRIIIC